MGRVGTRGGAAALAGGTSYGRRARLVTRPATGRRCLRRLILAAVATATVGGAAAAPAGAAVEPVSVAADGGPANGPSRHAAISADGRFVAFDGLAANIVAGDSNPFSDVFVRDRQARSTELISVSSAEVQGDGEAAVPSISADGRFVAFASGARNLAPVDRNGPIFDVFVRDRRLGTTELVSVGSLGLPSDGFSSAPSISADGRYVAFQSSASSLVEGDTNGSSDVFVRDRLARTTQLVSSTPGGTPGNGFSGRPSISADGRHVAFLSAASDLVGGDTNGVADVFIRDLDSGLIERVSVADGGGQANAPSSPPATSGGGRYVAFYSLASNLARGGEPGRDLYLRDRRTGSTRLVGAGGPPTQVDAVPIPAISPGARFVAFASTAADLVAGDVQNEDVFRLELSTRRVGLVSRSEGCSGSSRGPSLSEAGAVAFTSTAALAAPDADADPDVFVADGIVRDGGCGGGMRKRGRCFGKPVTIRGARGRRKLRGTKRRDVIAGSKRSDRIDGRGGNDLICAFHGADKVKGGPGKDRVRGGGGGNDRVAGGGGDDRLIGGKKPDRLSGGGGDDRLSGKSRNDRLRGGAGRDRIKGGPGDDRCRSGPGADVLKACER